MKTAQNILEKIQNAGLKATSQRIIIFQKISEMHNHPSAELVYKELSKEHPSISLATVYKTLETFADAGLINKIASANGILRYDPKTQAHNHLYCTNTNEIYDFYDEELHHYLEEFIASKKISNFKLKDMKLIVKGEKIDANKTINIK